MSSHRYISGSSDSASGRRDQPMANKWRGGAYNPHLEPDGKVRQSQAASTFGPGAMIDLVHDAVVIGGLDFWRYDDKPGRVISEPPLRDATPRRPDNEDGK